MAFQDRGVENRVLVTGAAGFVGRFLTELLVRQGLSVTGLGKEVAPAWWPDGANWVEADLLDPRSLEDVPRHWGGVVHLAGITVPSRFSDPSVAMENVAMTISLAEHILSGRFLLVSSALVYGSSGERLAEDCRKRPRGLYGLSKHLSEEVTLQHGERLDVRIARPFNHIGPCMQPDLVIPSIVRRVIASSTANEPIRMLGQNTTRDFVDVRDVVSAYSEILRAPTLSHNVYNVCSGFGTSLKEIVEIALLILGMERRIEFADKSVSGDDVPRVIGDSTRLQSDTGWKPKIALRDSIAAVIQASIGKNNQ